jgi:hypothetical protein
MQVRDFIKQTSRAGWVWFVEVANHASAALLLLGLAIAGGFTALKTSPWVGVALLGIALMAILFAGSYRVSAHEYARAEDLDARLQALNAKPSFAFDVALYLNDRDRYLLRLAVINYGPQDLESPLLNILVPAAWTPFGPCDDRGEWIVNGALLPSDEALRLRDGSEIPTVLWAGEVQRSFRANIATWMLYRIDRELPSGEYPISVRIPGYAREDAMISFTTQTNAGAES